MYKLIAIDIDGTLLNNQHEITKEVKETITKAKKSGIHIVLCSGRPILGMQGYIHELGLNREEDYAIAYNGAYTENNHTKEVISSILLEHKDLINLYNLSQSLNAPMHFYDYHTIYNPYRDINKYTIKEAYLTGIPLRYTPIDEIPKDLQIPKVLYIDEPNNLTKTVEKLPKELYEKFNIVRNAAYFLAFVHPAASKGNAVKNLSERLGIKRDEVMSIGDNENDISMIEYAGCGVAMGNAVTSLKSVADFQTLTNEENGVAHAIEKIVFRS